METLLLILLTAFALTAVTVAFRQANVAEFRFQLMKCIDAADPNFEILIREYRNVSNQEMMWPFWQPLESYFHGTSLILYWEREQEQSR